MRRSLTLVFLPIVVLLGAGCGGTDQAAAVRSTINRFAQATARQDYRTMCSLLAPSLVRNVEQIGLPCEIALSRGLASVHQPRLVVRSVHVSGDRATAQVHTSAINQKPLDGTIGLEHLSAGWRLLSLAAAGG